MNKKKCLVIGYINNNLGDDLFFKILFERYPNVDFYFFPPAKLLKIYKRKYRKNKNIKFYDKEPYYKNLKRHHSLDVIDIFQLVKKAAENVDFYINIGGSIFIQNDDWKNDDRFIIKDIIKDKPSFIVGCNFGPGDKEYEKYYKEWFKKFDDVCFRDKESYNKFSDLKNTRLSDDIVLIDKKNYNKKQKKEKSVGISIINLNKKTNYKEHKEDYYNFIKKSIVDLLEENYQVNLFSFCENEGDLEAAKEIKNLLPKKDRKK